MILKLQLPLNSFFICSRFKHFGDANEVSFVEDKSPFELFENSPVDSSLTWGTECDENFSTGFGSGFTNDDKLHVTVSFLDPSSLDESMELDSASVPLSLELSLSLSLCECLISKEILINANALE